jgi:pilus assembly protein Flp/PilA
LEVTLVLSNVKSVLVNEDGATLVEYALIVSLIAIACIAVITTLGGTIKTAFTTLSTDLAKA